MELRHQGSGISSVATNPQSGIRNPKSPARLRDLGLSIGDLPVGPSNTIIDVPGIRVGHCSLRDRPTQPGGKPVLTGVSVIIPGQRSLVGAPLPAAVDVFNGFGKSAGTVQIQELGQLESPIFLCSTLNLGRVWDAAMSILLEQNPKANTVNPAVFECNDARLNDVRGRHTGEDHVRQAYISASTRPPNLGSVGAGTGMRALGFKGGIGSASRLVKTDTLGEATLGVMTLNNFGGRLTWRGRSIPPPTFEPEQQRGSVIVVVGVNAPLDTNTLRRIVRRTWAGIARVGSNFAHGSGDVAVAFALPSSDGTCPDRLLWKLDDRDLGPLFTAAADATEESVWDCLLLAGEVPDPTGRIISRGLRAEELLAVASSTSGC